MNKFNKRALLSDAVQKTIYMVWLFGGDLNVARGNGESADIKRVCVLHKFQKPILPDSCMKFPHNKATQSKSS